MDNAPSQNPIPVPSAPVAAPQMLCPQCHQPVTPSEYYCPNCGQKLQEPGLSTDITAQILLYGFSIVLPVICYLAVSHWQGIKYVRSADPKAQQIGWIAITLLVISSVVTFWYAGVAINQFIQAQTSTAGLSQYGI